MVPTAVAQIILIALFGSLTLCCCYFYCCFCRADRDTSEDMDAV